MNNKKFSDLPITETLQEEDKFLLRYYTGNDLNVTYNTFKKFFKDYYIKLVEELSNSTSSGLEKKFIFLQPYIVPQALEYQYKNSSNFIKATEEIDDNKDIYNYLLDIFHNQKTSPWRNIQIKTTTDNFNRATDCVLDLTNETFSLPFFIRDTMNITLSQIRFIDVNYTKATVYDNITDRDHPNTLPIINIPLDAAFHITSVVNPNYLIKNNTNLLNKESYNFTLVYNAYKNGWKHGYAYFYLNTEAINNYTNKPLQDSTHVDNYITYNSMDRSVNSIISYTVKDFTFNLFSSTFLPSRPEVEIPNDLKISYMAKIPLNNFTTYYTGTNIIVPTGLTNHYNIYYYIGKDYDKSNFGYFDLSNNILDKKVNGYTDSEGEWVVGGFINSND